MEIQKKHDRENAKLIWKLAFFGRLSICKSSGQLKEIGPKRELESPTLIYMSKIIA